MSASDNLPQVFAALTEMEKRLDLKIGAAATEISLRLEGAAKRNIKGERPPGQKATSGFAPMNRTGDLRRSIAGTTNRVGFKSYQAVVGAYMVYAQTVETGNPAPPTWTEGQRFPFLQPAVDSFVKTNGVARVLQKHLRSV